ncbi:hypothetical protein NCS56_00491000 [Fusarium sp. Ph1]|nr:hypothetical protein NCS56_00491000 [Fusarium sp. Ph1]
MAESPSPPSASAYFELSWAILSTIGLANVVHGFMVVGIIGWSRIVFVPITVSAAGALANGLCYYAFYSNHALEGKLAASAFGDFFWLIEEAGLSLYNYLILIKILDFRSRVVFQACYWAIIVVVSALKLAILYYRIRLLLSPSDDMITLIGRLHIGYFGGIAAAECISAALLLRHFSSAYRTSTVIALRGGLFKYLMRSTEIRVAMLCLIGVSRAITYSFQATAQSATTLAGQFDRFAATLEMLFPVVMYIDLLASRLKFADDVRANSTSLQRCSTSGSRVHRQPASVLKNTDTWHLEDREYGIEMSCRMKRSDESMITQAAPQTGIK